MVPDTPGSRLAALFALVPDVAFADIDRAAGFASLGYAKQAARGAKCGPVVAGKLAPVFGVLTDWILYGRGRAPGKRRVRAAVLGAVERIKRAGGAHTPRKTRATGARQRRARSAGRA